jgi:hypothetical protein
MKRLLFAVLMMVCSVSWAEWEFWDRGDDFSVYIDKSTITRKREIAKIWVLIDYFEEQTNYGKKFKSQIIRDAYNCVEELATFAGTAKYSGVMGTGKVVESFAEKENNQKWELVLPGSNREKMLKLLCGKK